MQRSSVKFALVLALIGCVGFTRAFAGDEPSIKALTRSFIALGSDIDPHEAELLSITVHTMSRDLARRYGVTGDPAFHNFLINTGHRTRGYCAHYVRDIGTRLREMNFKTL